MILAKGFFWLLPFSAKATTATSKSVLRWSFVFAALVLFVFVGVPVAVTAENATNGSQQPEDRFHYDPTDWINRIYGPQDWNLVTCNDVNTCPGWPTNYEKFNPFIPYNESENMCMDCSDSIEDNCYDHRQSPIPLNRNVTATYECEDRHLMRYGKGMCQLEKMNFEILPHVLRAYQPKKKCPGIQPWIDFSLGFPDPWLLKYTDISVPSQHVQDGKRYDAEVVLSHVYSKDNPKKLIGNLAIFLERGRASDHYDFLELYLREWKTKESSIQEECGLRRLREKRQRRRRRRPRRRRVPTTPAPTVVQDDALALLNLSGIISDDLLIPNVDDIDDTDDGSISIPLNDTNRGVTVDLPYFNRDFHPYDWYAKSKTEYYFRYVGSLLEPPCFQSVHWRVLKDAIKVSPDQIQELERLIADRIDPVTCEKYSAGRERFPNRLTWRVGVNRPLQMVSERHNLVYCECIDWVSRAENDKEYCKLPRSKRGVKKFAGVPNNAFTNQTNPWNITKT